MSFELGIDIGTTWTAAATWSDGGGDLVKLGRGHIIPSVVAVTDDGVFVGDEALEIGLEHPEQLAREFKRRIGDVTTLIVGGEPWSVERLTARLLQAVVERSTAALGATAEHLTLTHPANWGSFRIDQYEQAIDLAQLSMPYSLIPEPVAAALEFATHESITPGDHIAVYDLGGGTFDAAVLRRTAPGFEALAHYGIEHLGGADFDAVIVDHVVRNLPETHPALGDPEDPGVRALMAQVHRACVHAKEHLSDETRVTIVVPPDGTEVAVNRTEFEQAIRGSISETTVALGRAVEKAGISWEAIGHILLVGGSSRIPLVSEAVSSLGPHVVTNPTPKYVTALGAARARHHLSESPLPIAPAGVVWNSEPPRPEAALTAPTAAAPWTTVPPPPGPPFPIHGPTPPPPGEAWTDPPHPTPPPPPVTPPVTGPTAPPTQPVNPPGSGRQGQPPGPTPIGYPTGSTGPSVRSRRGPAFGVLACIGLFIGATLLGGLLQLFGMDPDAADEEKSSDKNDPVVEVPEDLDTDLDEPTFEVTDLPSHLEPGSSVTYLGLELELDRVDIGHPGGIDEAGIDFVFSVRNQSNDPDGAPVSLTLDGSSLVVDGVAHPVVAASTIEVGPGETAVVRLESGGIEAAAGWDDAVLSLAERGKEPAVLAPDGVHRAAELPTTLDIRETGFGDVMNGTTAPVDVILRRVIRTVDLQESTGTVRRATRGSSFLDVCVLIESEVGIDFADALLTVDVGGVRHLPTTVRRAPYPDLSATFCFAFEIDHAVVGADVVVDGGNGAYVWPVPLEQLGGSLAD